MRVEIAIPYGIDWHTHIQQDAHTHTPIASAVYKQYTDIQTQINHPFTHPTIVPAPPHTKALCSLASLFSIPFQDALCFRRISLFHPFVRPMTLVLLLLPGLSSRLS